MDISGRGMPRVSLDDVYLAPVHLNVGGTTYTTTLDTLTRYPDSKIAKLFNGTLSVPVDSINNHYFLDVNGSVFAHILDFLRYKELILPEGFSQLQLLKKQAEYFEIEDMVRKLENIIDDEQGNQKESELSEEDHCTTPPTKHKPRHKRKKSNETASHTLEKERSDGKITGEREEKNDVFEKGVKEKENVAKTIDHTSLRRKNTNLVIVRSSTYKIDIYSLAKVTLEEPIPEEPVLNTDNSWNGLCTHYVCKLVYNNALPHTLHFVNQLQNKGYHLVSVNFSHPNSYIGSLHEFVLYRGKL